jgi:hypothetical protein
MKLAENKPKLEVLGDGEFRQIEKFNPRERFLGYLIMMGVVFTLYKMFATQVKEVYPFIIVSIFLIPGIILAFRKKFIYISTAKNVFKIVISYGVKVSVREYRLSDFEKVLISTYSVGGNSPGHIAGTTRSKIYVSIIHKSEKATVRLAGPKGVVMFEVGKPFKKYKEKYEKTNSEAINLANDLGEKLKLPVEDDRPNNGN